MIYVIVVLFVIIICRVILFSWHRKFLSDIKSIEKKSELSIEEFESLCHPTRCFTGDEVQMFLKKNKKLRENIRNIYNLKSATKKSFAIFYPFGFSVL